MPMSADAKQELRVLTAGAEEVLPADALAERLQAARAEGRPLRVKLGIDPSSPHLTLGHAVVLRKLAQFQRFGHTVVLIIGNFTGLVGDPSGRSQTRNRQTEAEVAEHIRTYLEQVDKVLDVSAAEIRYNAEWLAPDLAGGIPLPAHAGHGLGGHQGRRRAGGHRPDLQPADRPGAAAGSRPGRPGRDDHAAAARH